MMSVTASGAGEFAVEVPAARYRGVVAPVDIEIAQLVQG
jgi:hypothetical protein